MRKRNVLYIFLISVVLCLSGCKEEEKKEVTAPIDAGSLLDKYADSESGSTEHTDNASSSTTEFVDPDSDVVWNTTTSTTPTTNNTTTAQTEKPTVQHEQQTTSAPPSTGVTWTLNNGTLTISGKGEMKDNPWISQRNSITNVIIEDGVTSIRKNAFDGCTSLTGITIPSSVTSIGYKAFYNCSSLSNIDIPNTVTSIGSHAFYGCSSLESIVVPNTVTRIEAYTFSNCTGLANLTIPGSVTYIGDYALENCPPTMTIYGQKDSVAQSYALKLYFAFVIR